VILGPVIVDFFAPSAMLVVEVDGAVLRVEAQLVEARVDLAVDMVRRALAD
jgi:very-short-patch-repair endonuclease